MDFMLEEMTLSFLGHSVKHPMVADMAYIEHTFNALKIWQVCHRAMDVECDQQGGTMNPPGPSQRWIGFKKPDHQLQNKCLGCGCLFWRDFYLHSFLRNVKIITHLATLQPAMSLKNLIICDRFVFLQVQVYKAKQIFHIITFTICVARK